MPVRNASKVKQAPKSFQLQLDKSQIKEMRGTLKSLKGLKKEVTSPIKVTENIVADVWVEDGYLDSFPTIYFIDFVDTINEYMYVENLRKESKNSKLSDLENLIIFISEKSLDFISDLIEISAIEPMKSEFDRRIKLLEAACKEFNAFFVNAAGLSKKEGEVLLQKLSTLTFDESTELINGLLKGDVMVID